MAYDMSIYYYLKPLVHPIYLSGSKDETIIRCPICGDSKKDKTKARFYINNEPPFKFYCFNCDTYGIVNRDILELITDGDYNSEVYKDIEFKQREYKKNNNHRVSRKTKNNPYFNAIPNFDCDKSYLDKLGYLENRLDVTLDYNDISRFKIVLSIIDFFDNNGLDINKRCGNSDKVVKVVERLDRDYIGFLSSDKNIIIFRNIADTEEAKKYRFNNFKIFTDEPFSKKTYNIATQIDKYQDHYIADISEGPIDIIGAYYGIYDGKVPKDRILLANGGKGYLNSAEFLASKTLLNCDYNIYSDKDVSIDYYKRLKKISPIFGNSNMNIYYNNLYKDFGVMKDKIELSRRIKL